MTLVHSILASRELQPMMGNPRQKLFDLALGHFWTITESHIDKALTDLEKDGWGENKIAKREDQPNRKEYSITKNRRAGLRRGMTLPVIGARALEYSEADSRITGSASGTELRAHLDQVSQPPSPSPYGFIAPARP